ncbi:hypothetical protein F4861DRAFT_527450 [Xylaria intraflava]|nr:hypothetical protein F4861DRAFT_527450 [Xylaria intraflava]
MASSSYTAPTNVGAISLYEHLSPQATAMLLQRRDEHIQKLREGWQAERARLEASRDQTEAMFGEERAMMNEERLLWAEQKVKFQNEIMDWKTRTEVAEDKAAELAKLLELMCNGAARRYEVFDRAAKTLEFGSDPRDSPDVISPISLSPLPGGSSIMPESKRLELDQQAPSIDTIVIPGPEIIQLKAPETDKSTFYDEKQSSHTTSSRKWSLSDLSEGLAEAQLEPSDDDPALKGPLGLTNQPLPDEMFLKELWDKLEEVKATDATPSAAYEAIIPESTETNDSAGDNHPEGTNECPEGDIPLRFRQTSNFGQPFGQLGHAYAP